MAIAFTPSQLSYKEETSPINFRISHFRLLFSDLQLVPILLATLYNTVTPFRTDNPRSELNLRSPGNVTAFALQAFLAIGTLTGFVGGLVIVFLPISVVTFGLYVVIAVVIFSPGILPVEGDL
jgi:hypothetical protein